MHSIMTELRIQVKQERVAREFAFDVLEVLRDELGQQAYLDWCDENIEDGMSWNEIRERAKIALADHSPMELQPHKFHPSQQVIYNRQDYYTDFIGLSPTVEATVFAQRRGSWQQPMYEIKWGKTGWAIVEEERLMERNQQ